MGTKTILIEAGTTPSGIGIFYNTVSAEPVLGLLAPCCGGDLIYNSSEGEEMLCTGCSIIYHGFTGISMDRLGWRALPTYDPENTLTQIQTVTASTSVEALKGWISEWTGYPVSRISLMLLFS